jgi:single-stranded-DNA-specific exonuclease
MSMFADSPTATTPEVTRSFSGKPWRLRAADDRLALSLQQKFDLPDALARLLAARKIGLEEAGSFLEPRLRDLLPDPHSLKDCARASARIADAVRAGEQIGIFGDYDVDGATSSALLSEALGALGLTPLIHIPDRMKEGYGPNAPALLALGEKGAKLILTVDCGTVAYAPLEAAANAGLDVIVIDHHQGEPELPKSYAVVNPNRADEPANDCQHMAAVGVSFLLLVAVWRNLQESGWFETHPKPDLLQWLDIVALGTVCDVMPLTGINRALVAQGLKRLATREHLGLRILGDRAGLSDTPSAYHFGFVFGPRINAGGRVGQADLGVRLLTTKDEEEARDLAEALEHFNAERKALEALALEEALAQAEAKLHQNPSLPLLLLHAQSWHPGVIGIVAGRVKERFGLPTMILAQEGDVAKASCRSITGVDIGAAVANAKTQGLLLAGGGHAMAAGFSAEVEKLPALEAYFAQLMGAQVEEAQRGAHLRLDGMIGLSGITVDLAEKLGRLAPYGNGNPTPKWWIPNVQLVQVDVLNGQHVRLLLADGALAGRANSTRIKAMAFRIAETELGQQLLNARGKMLHIAGTIQVNHWNGRSSAELILEDAAAAN